MILFDSSLDPFLSGFALVNVLSTFGSDAISFMNFSTEFLIDGFHGLGHLFVFNPKDPRSKIYVDVYMIVLC